MFLASQKDETEQRSICDVYALHEPQKVDGGTTTAKDESSKGKDNIQAFEFYTFNSNLC